MSTPIDFSGRTVIVTGAGNGIGRAHALMLGSRGASVVVNDIGGTVNGVGGDGAAAQSVVDEIQAAGGTAIASTESVAAPEGGEAVVARAVDTFGRVDAVIHNAGILRDRSFAKVTGDDIDPVLDVHLRGAFNVLRPAWPHMIEQRYGRILLTTSASGLLGNYGQASYAAGKAGLLGLMNVLSVEGARHGILANALSPTAATRMTEGLLGELTEHFDPRHVAAVATYLVSERCELTHHVLSASGGRVARLFVGSTRGWYGGREPVEPEAVHDALEEILDLDDFVVPKDGDDEVALILEALQGS
ncbi:SDR family NAD(P)-dependent oxidoreductase [Nocardioides alcanivorans]|uniref:SDR family NAD(P)-dependent oxidoreductase n=1 Tax=Nocardioides alcanivorans TaxID=2897352 RepID=UPI001F32E337|nr:SDR family NAD(P)-dependent oxidoreductase [Nocardioides alcanivorans]